MSIFYLDTSAWVKRYEKEAGTAWIEQFWRGGPRIGVSPLGLVEVAAAIARRHAGQKVPADVTNRVLASVRQDYAMFTRVDFVAPVEEVGVELARRHRLRGADAVHLASALHLRQTADGDVVMVASDAELLAAARAEGLRVLDPQSDPPLPLTS
ncbi:MAG: type II toxin-antitoxin system VapC family toxin [Phycisphaerae bacterium]